MRWWLQAWFWMAPPGLVQAFVLLTSSKVWEAHVVPALRGPNRTSTDGSGILVAMLVVPVLLALTEVELFRDMLRFGGRGMRPPTEEEAGCAVVLLRVSLVALYWLLAWRALHLA